MRIHAIQTGTVAIPPNQRQGKGPGLMRLINTFVDRRWTEPLPIYVWVIEHPKGVIVIDTGETAKSTVWHSMLRQLGKPFSGFGSLHRPRRRFSCQPMTKNLATVSQVKASWRFENKRSAHRQLPMNRRKSYV